MAEKNVAGDRAEQTDHEETLEHVDGRLSGKVVAGKYIRFGDQVVRQDAVLYVAEEVTER